MKAKLGMSPIAWWNDDLPQLSDDVSLEECLRQSRSAEGGATMPVSSATSRSAAAAGASSSASRLPVTDCQ